MHRSEKKGMKKLERGKIMKTRERNWYESISQPKYDITLEEDAFRKAVTREKDFWKPFIKRVFESVLK